MNKTVYRLFTVLAVVIVLISIVSPLAFSVKVDGNIYKLPIDNSFPTLYSYFFGNNTGIVDYKYNNSWYRVVLNNNFAKAILDTETISNRTHYILRFDFMNRSSSGICWYLTNIGSTYTSSSPFTSVNWYDTLSTSYDLGTNYPYVNSCAACIQCYLTDTQSQYCDFNSFYPLVSVSGNGANVDLSPILNNQQTIISRINELEISQSEEDSKNQSRYNAQESANNSRASSQEEAANSRQSEIMEAGSDITVSTIDNWIGGENGLANKLTNVAATLSDNVGRFSSNQAVVSSKLANAGAFVSGVFGKFPAVVVACMFCFLVILIAVKVVGR